jgi:hypothetical protein
MTEFSQFSAGFVPLLARFIGARFPWGPRTRLGRRDAMANIVARSAGSVTSRTSWYTGRALAQIDNRTEIGLAEIEAKAELQAARVVAVGYVGKRAMHEVAMISRLEQQLAALVPMATARLQAIGDMVALEATDVVADTVRRVR